MSEKKQWETKNNSGSAFKNRRKQKDTHPDYTGEIRVNNELFWLNVWVKETQAGDPWFSYSVSPKEERSANVDSFKPKAQPEPEVNDDTIPF